MTIHFICRGNVLRSLIAEAYLKSLSLKDIRVISSGTNVDLNSPTEHQYFLNTIALLRRHGISDYAKVRPEQLTQRRIDGQDITICMNQRVIDEAKAKVILPPNTLNWDITDIGEGNRTASEEKRETYEEEIYNEIIARVDQLINDYQLR